MIMDLIDREALVEELNELYGEQTVSKYSYSRDCKEARFGIALAINKVKTAPTVDAEPVRHGKWLKFIDNGIEYQTCSECNYDMPVGGADYWCQKCGCRMDGE